MAILRQELVAQEELLRQESSLVEDVTKFVRHNFWDQKFNILMSVVTKASFCELLAEVPSLARYWQGLESPIA